MPCSMSEPSVEAIRTALAADFGPRTERARDRWPATTRDEAIGGVPCQIILPADGPVVGTILYFFGGGYVSGSPEFDLPITAALASQARMRVVAPRYALAPEHPLPVGFNQCIAVRNALAAEGAYSLSGESAGGGMALAVVHAGFAAGIRPPDALALFSPWSDLREEATAQGEGIDDPTLTTDDLRLAARCYLADASASDLRASPALSSIPEGWPDTLLTTGSRDRLRPSVHALAARVAASDAACEVIDRDGMWHVFEVYDEFPESFETLRHAADFIADRSARA